jgi:hypothetical protein
MSKPETSADALLCGCRMPWRAIPGLALLLAVMPVPAADIVDAELQGSLLEHHAPEVKVSGNIIVGVMGASAYQALTSDLLAIRSPDTGIATLCLKVTSRDGAYTSRNDYRSDTAPAILRLPYHSRMQDTLGRYASKPGYIAITATRGDCDISAPSDYYLPLAIDSDRGELTGGPVSIYINGFDATDVYYRLTGAGDGEFTDCHYIEEGRHTAYNFSCEIPELPSGTASPLTVEILREVYGRELEPLTINILATR